LDGFWVREPMGIKQKAFKSQYLYRAVDSNENTLDWMLSPERDKDAAKRFLKNCLETNILKRQGLSMPTAQNHSHLLFKKVKKKFDP
jgi:transposase-like protein